jgi:hypothetical protein
MEYSKGTKAQRASHLFPWDIHRLHSEFSTLQDDFDILKWEFARSSQSPIRELFKNISGQDDIWVAILRDEIQQFVESSEPLLSEGGVITNIEIQATYTDLKEQSRRLIRKTLRLREQLEGPRGHVYDKETPPFKVIGNNPLSRYQYRKTYPIQSFKFTIREPKSYTPDQSNSSPSIETAFHDEGTESSAPTTTFNLPYSRNDNPLHHRQNAGVTREKRLPKTSTILDPSEFPPVFEPDSLEEDPDWLPDVPASRTRFFEKKRSSAGSGSPTSKEPIATPELMNTSQTPATESGSSSTSGTAQQEESWTGSRASPDVTCPGQLQNNSPEIVEQESDLEILEERTYTMNGPRKLKRAVPVPDDGYQIVEIPTHPRGLRKPEKALQSNAVKGTIFPKRSTRDVYDQSDLEDENQNAKRRKIMERKKAMLLSSPPKRVSQNSKLSLSNLYIQRKKASLSNSPPKGNVGEVKVIPVKSITNAFLRPSLMNSYLS